MDRIDRGDVLHLAAPTAPLPPPPAAWPPAHVPPATTGPRSFPPPSPTAPAGPAGPAFRDHLRRAVEWNMGELHLTEKEHAELLAAGVAAPQLQVFLAWRRSCLIVATPVLLFTLILTLWETLSADTVGLTELGVLTLWIPPVALALVPIGAMKVIKQWTEIGATSKRLVLCWAWSIFLPLVAAIIPLEYIVDFSAAREAAGGDETALQLLEGEIFTARLMVVVAYALTLLPIVVSVPSGVMKGAVRIKALFPIAILPGWFLIAVAPFYSLFLIVLFVLIEQIVGNLLLVLGIGLLAFSPWLYLIHRHVYARSMTVAEAREEMPRAGRTGSRITIAGLACVALFALTAKVGALQVVGASDDQAVFTYVQIVRTGVEFISRTLVTTVVFSVIFLTMVHAEWRNIRSLSVEMQREHEAEMEELERFTQHARPEGQS